MNTLYALLDPAGPIKEVSWTPYVLLTLAVILLVGTLLFYAGKSTSVPPRILSLGTSFFFWLGMGYLAMLLLAAGVYIHGRESLQPYLIRGLLPVAIPWFGALGGVVISLEGVFLKNDQWDTKYNYWHIGRPLFGAVLGIVSFFLYIVIISASGTKPKFLEVGPGATNAYDFIVFYMVAFLVGYREETFRELIKRVTDLVLKPPSSTGTAPKVGFKDNGAPATAVAFAPSAAGSSASRTLEIVNTGDAALQSPSLEVTPTNAASTGVFVLANDKVTGGGDLAPGQGRTVEVAFKPTASGSFSGTLTLKAQNLAAPKTLAISGTAP